MEKTVMQALDEAVKQFGGKVVHCHFNSIEDRIKDDGKKCYVLIISRYFLKSHPRTGEPTHFIESIENGSKIHTMRGNYELWRKRTDEVNTGEAYLSLRYWSASPYNYLRDDSTQIEFKRLYKAGLQSIGQHFYSEKCSNGMYRTTTHTQIDGRHPGVKTVEIAANDGLMYPDFKRWFFPNHKKNDVYRRDAIIHFTDFKY